MKYRLLLLALIAFTGCRDGAERDSGILRLSEPDRIAAAASDRWDILRAFFPPGTRSPMHARYSSWPKNVLMRFVGGGGGTSSGDGTAGGGVE